MSFKRQASLVLVAPLVVASSLGLWWYFLHPFVSRIDRAYRLCNECGIEPGGVDSFVETMKESVVTREGELEQFREQFKRREDAKLCEPCAEALLVAAGK